MELKKQVIDLARLFMKDTFYINKKVRSKPGGQCWATSKAFVKFAKGRLNYVKFKVKDYFWGYHSAILIEHEIGETLVLDFTAKQFDKKKPPMYIDTVDGYWKWMSDVYHHSEG